MRVTQYRIEGLGHLSTLVADEAAGVAAVIDPRRDVDVYLAAAHASDLRITHVLETHLHNDYVSGGRELAAISGATHVIGAGAELAHDYRPAHDGDAFDVGSIRFRTLDTPGHTPEHVSYSVADTSRADEPFLLLTGGSLLVGAVGRTDLLGAENARPYAAAMYHSLHDVLLRHEDSVMVYPTHGAGSLCSTGIASTSWSTIGYERRHDPLLAPMEVDAFAHALLTGQPTFPRYFARMRPINRAGPAPVDLSPPEPVDPVEIRRRIHAGEWVVDLRSRTAFARGHLTGTVNLEIGDSFATYLGWTMQWGSPVTLVGDTADQVAEAQRQMARIGIDRPAGAADHGIETWAAGGEVRTYRTATFAELADSLAEDPLVILDVRRDDEWAAGRIAGAVHIPLQDLEGRLDQVPDGQVWVHCASGYRASLAASLLDRAGRSVVAVDDDGADAANQDTLPNTTGD